MNSQKTSVMRIASSGDKNNGVRSCATSTNESSVRSTTRQTSLANGPTATEQSSISWLSRVSVEQRYSPSRPTRNALASPGGTSSSTLVPSAFSRGHASTSMPSSLRRLRRRLNGTRPSSIHQLTNSRPFPVHTLPRDIAPYASSCRSGTFPTMRSRPSSRATTSIRYSENTVSSLQQFRRTEHAT